MRLKIAILAWLTLVCGFGLAQATGNRALGGVLLLLGAGVCTVLWWKLAGLVPTILSVVICGVAFVVSHPLGKLVGAWPSVVLVAVIAGCSAYALTGSRRT